MLKDKKLEEGHPYYLKDGIFWRYISENKHVFETTVMLLSLSRQLLK